MRTRIVEPRTARLELSGGDWLLVKEQLNAGETMDLFDRAAPGVDLTQPGAMAKLSPMKVGPALVGAYLLDWSLVDAQGQVIPIRGQSPEAIEALLRAFDLETLTELMNAVSGHDARMREKKRHLAATASSAPSPSLVGAVGGTNG